MRGLRSARAFLLLAAVGASACSIDPAALAVADTFFQGTNPQVDAVFVVDDSNSMEDLQGRLAAAIPGFLTALGDAGAEYRVGVVTTDMNDPNRRGRLVGGSFVSWEDANPGPALAAAVRPGVAGSQLERGIDAGWSALTPPLSTHDNEGLRRDGARVAVIVVSDEDDCSDEGALPSSDPAACTSFAGELVSVTEYAERFRSIVEEPEDVAVHALVETGNAGEFEGCGGLNVGTRYVRLARSLGGFVAPHCADMDASMTELALQLSGRRTAFPLSRTPDPLTITVTVARDVQPLGGDDDDSAAGPPPANGVEPGERLQGTQVREDVTRADGWTFDGDSNTLRLWGEARPGLGDAIQIRYQVATSG